MPDLEPLPDALVKEVIASQRSSGAFASTMHDAGQCIADENAFVTGQVLRALGRHTADPRLQKTVSRALDFLESAEDEVQPAAYRFWPAGKRPPGIPAYPADADDTALVGLQLLRHRRRTPAEVMRSVCHVLIHYRVPPGVPPANWVKPGAFWTWLEHDRGYNLVDCTVNANVLGLMAGVGLQTAPGFAAACETIEQGIRIAAGEQVLTRLLSPYYPHPVELLYALRHAVHCGADGLRPSLHLVNCRWQHVQPNPLRPVCCSAYGQVQWTCPLLHRLRAVTEPLDAVEGAHLPDTQAMAQAVR